MPETTVNNATALSGEPAAGSPDRATLRARALHAAAVCAERGSPPGFVLSSARQFERYLTAGLSQVGSNRLERLIGGDEKVVVEVDLRAFSPDLAAKVADIVKRDVAAVMSR